MSLILSHVDLRVRNRAMATEFYDALLSTLGAIKHTGEDFTSWRVPPRDAPDDWDGEWFGIIEDPQHVPNGTRIAFAAPTRGTIDAIATILPAIGALAIEGPSEAYGPDYYACFFEDPDGNKLEICCLG